MFCAPIYQGWPFPLPGRQCQGGVGCQPCCIPEGIFIPSLDGARTLSLSVCTVKNCLVLNANRTLLPLRNMLFFQWSNRANVTSRRKTFQVKSSFSVLATELTARSLVHTKPWTSSTLSELCLPLYLIFSVETYIHGWLFIVHEL